MRGNGGQILVELTGVITVKTSLCEVYYNQTGSWVKFSVYSCTV